MDESFEFDAPRYCDFTSGGPESPSRTDAWFDTLGKIQSETSVLYMDNMPADTDIILARSAEGSPGNGLMSPGMNEVQL